MSCQTKSPFDSIEASHGMYQCSLKRWEGARHDVEAEVAAAERDGAARRKQALLLVSYTLTKLNRHITAQPAHLERSSYLTAPAAGGTRFARRGGTRTRDDQRRFRLSAGWQSASDAS